MSPDVIGYYQTIMYAALGITGQRNVLVAGIYNIVGPIASECFRNPHDRLLEILIRI